VEVHPEFEGLVDALPDGVVVTAADGRVVLVNQMAEKLTGYTLGELVGQPVEMLVPARLRAGHVGHREGFRTSGWPTRPMGEDLEIVLARADGTELPVDISVSRVDTSAGTCVVAAIRDASARRQAEATIREAQRRWRALVDNVDLLVVELDRYGRVRYASPFVSRLTGYGADELEGMDWLDRMLPDEDAASVREVFDATLSEHGVRSHVNAIRTRDGQGRRVAWFNTVTRDTHGAVTGTLSVGHDITDQQRLTVLEERDRMAARLHSSIVQQLFSVGLRVSSVLAGADGHDDHTATQLQQAVDELDQVIVEVRSTIFDRTGPHPA
jgi:PAS domain S-box-containing protein